MRQKVWNQILAAKNQFWYAWTCFHPESLDNLKTFADTNTGEADCLIDTVGLAYTQSAPYGSWCCAAGTTGLGGEVLRENIHPRRLACMWKSVCLNQLLELSDKEAHMKTSENLGCCEIDEFFCEAFDIYRVYLVHPTFVVIFTVHAYWLFKGSLEVKLSTIWRVEKQSREVESEDEKQRREVESEERRYNRAKVRRKESHTREMLGKSGNAVFFRWFVGQLGRKVGSLKRWVRR